jgi:hypothetical protein
MAKILYRKDFIMDQEEIRASWEWFSEAIFGKRFVDERIKESRERVYTAETYITANELYRDSFINDVKIRAYNKLTKGAVSFHEYLLVGEQLFKLVK